MGNKKKAARQQEEALRGVEAACAAAGWSGDDLAVLEAAETLSSALGRLESSSSAAAAAPGDAERSELWAWAVAQGARAHEHVGLGGAFGGGSGVFATTGAVEAGSVVFSIPLEPLALFATRGRDDGLAKFAAGLDAVNPTVALALRVVYEAQLGPRSTHCHYLAALPRSFDAPIGWKPESLALLAGASLRQACGAKRAAARVFCDISRARCLPRAVAWDEWVWAMGAVVTRQNAVPVDDGPPALCLFPLWDFCNHAIDSPRSSFVAGAMELRADKNLAPGDQIFMFYGPRADVDLVLHSGFCLGGRNPYDRLDLRVPLPPTPLRPLVASLLEKSNVPRVSDLVFEARLSRVDDAVQPDAALRAIALAAVADKPQAAHLMRASATDHAVWCPLDDDHDRRACVFLTRCCDAELASRVSFRARVRDHRRRSPPRDCDSTTTTAAAATTTKAAHDRLAAALFDTDLEMLVDAAAQIRAYLRSRGWAEE
ncbi:hypothetical protein CTAYLR_008726 [Chrysophaeum taylorii]|uniref:SET domain-containing protein n=1 Tax=Chrysophaeum taylorii TaxID=2483200 RepID=A0AAD7UKE7_9STRA|nr:hypothetical protein CTAYLR_008726 [Chrysophaeum taylorii]